MNTEILLLMAGFLLPFVVLGALFFTRCVTLGLERLCK